MHTAPTIEIFSRNDVILDQIDALALLGAEVCVVLTRWRNSRQLDVDDGGQRHMR